jgi:hypothetical protein
MSKSAVVASTQVAGLKDTKRIRFPQDFDWKHQQRQVKKEASCAPIPQRRFVAAAHG